MLTLGRPWIENYPRLSKVIPDLWDERWNVLKSPKTSPVVSTQPSRLRWLGRLRSCTDIVEIQPFCSFHAACARYCVCDAQVLLALAATAGLSFSLASEEPKDDGRSAPWSADALCCLPQFTLRGQRAQQEEGNKPTGWWGVDKLSWVGDDERGADEIAEGEIEGTDGSS